MLNQKTSLRPVLHVRNVCAILLMALVMGAFSACGQPDPLPLECDIQDIPAPECRQPGAFVDEPDAYRIEQHARDSRDQTAIVLLQPEDVGRILHVYPTTENDEWGDGGVLEFRNAADEALCTREGLCVSAFADGDWVIPDGAASVALTFPAAEFATVLFTIVIL